MRAVFLHGFGADFLSWIGLMGALPEIDCIAPDLRGHGSSVRKLNDGSIADLAEGVLEEIGDGPPAWLIGHSLGGGIALWLAAHHPNLWKGLILMAPLGLGERLDFSRLQQYPDIADANEMMGFLEGLVHDTSKIKPEFAAYALSQLDAPGGREALRKIVGKIPETTDHVESALSQVAKSGLDVSVFWGQNDSVARAKPELISGVGTLTQCPDTGHIVHVEAMDTITRHLRDVMGLT